MTIRMKTILVVLPLIIVPLAISVGAAILASRNGITLVATSFLQFKAEELNKYAQSEWDTLSRYDFSRNKQYLEIAKAAVAAYAAGIIKSRTELILAVDDQGDPVMEVPAVAVTAREKEALRVLFSSSAGGWRTLDLEGVPRVGQVFMFAPFRWLVLVTERRDVFYGATSQIVTQSLLILFTSLAAALFLLFLFTHYLTQPLQKVAAAMRTIIHDNDYTRTVDIAYRDEIGELGNTFNLMAAELDKAYGKIKSYAFSAVVAEKTEKKIRNIFQKYVPISVIEEFFKSPESMLVGDNRALAILFSDIRGFTSISEKLGPGEIVKSLNDYFSIMVDIVMKHSGIVDKYMGDALMAFFGAPLKKADDTECAVQAALEMQAGLARFNSVQRLAGKPEFFVGVGLNFGIVTIGNIGSEKKMDYTVIGDDVNIASRLEELTKHYPESLIISHTVYEQVRHRFPCRLIDKVVVRGKRNNLAMYAVRERLSESEQINWEKYDGALERYYKKDFDRARRTLEEIADRDPLDKLTAMFLHRSRYYLKHPPPADWTGIVEPRAA